MYKKLLVKGRYFDRWNCLTGNTKIPLLSGKEATLAKLYKYGIDNKYVYSFDGKKIVPGKINRIKRSEKKVPVYEVILDNNKKIRVTSNHRFLLLNGTYKCVSELNVGESLLPFYKRVGFENRCKGYEFIFHPKKGYRKWEATHKMVYNYTNNYENTKGKLIRHIDFNKQNNNPDNLLLTDNKKRSEGLKRAWARKKMDLVGKTVFNHKIKKIEFYGYEYVYDLEINETHNFALSAGVFVHNSALLYQHFNNIGFHCELVSLYDQDYNNFRSAVFSNAIRLINDDNLINEIYKLEIGNRGKVKTEILKDMADTVITGYKVLTTLDMQKGDRVPDGEGEIISENLSSQSSEEFIGSTDMPGMSSDPTEVLKRTLG